MANLEGGGGTLVDLVHCMAPALDMSFVKEVGEIRIGMGFIRVSGVGRD